MPLQESRSRNGCNGSSVALRLRVSTIAIGAKPSEIAFALRERDPKPRGMAFVRASQITCARGPVWARACRGRFLSSGRQAGGPLPVLRSYSYLACGVVRAFGILWASDSFFCSVLIIVQL